MWGYRYYRISYNYISFFFSGTHMSGTTRCATPTAAARQRSAPTRRPASAMTLPDAPSTREWSPRRTRHAHAPHARSTQRGLQAMHAPLPPCVPTPALPRASKVSTYGTIEALCRHLGTNGTNEALCPQLHASMRAICAICTICTVSTSFCPPHIGRILYRPPMRGEASPAPA